MCFYACAKMIYFVASLRGVSLETSKLSAMFFRGKTTSALSIIGQICESPEMGHFKEVVPLVFGDTVFSQGSSEGDIVSSTILGASSRTADCLRKWASSEWAATRDVSRGGLLRKIQTQFSGQ